MAPRLKKPRPIPDKNEDTSRWPDERLLLAVATLHEHGDERALRTLFQRHAPRFTALARHLKVAGSVEEAVQAAFLAIARDARCFEAGRMNARVWLVGMAHRAFTTLEGRGEERATG